MRQTIAQELAVIAERARSEQNAATHIEAHSYYHEKALPFIRREASNGKRKTLVSGGRTQAIADRLVDLLKADGFEAQQREMSSCDIWVAW